MAGLTEFRRRGPWISIPRLGAAMVVIALAITLYLKACS